MASSSPYYGLVNRALARSRAGKGGAATQKRLGLPVPYETLRQNNMRQAALEGKPFDQNSFEMAILRHARDQTNVNAGLNSRAQKPQKVKVVKRP